MKRFAIVVLTITLFSILPAQELKKDPAVDQFRQQISAINLLNTLFLTKAQYENYGALLNRMQETRDQLQRMVDGINSSLKSKYEDLYDEISRSKAASKNTAAAILDLQNQEANIQKQYEAKLFELDDQLNRLLTTSQLSLVDGYIPGLVPQNGNANPAALSQVSGEVTAAFSTFQRIRQVSEPKYAETRKKEIDEYLSRYEKKVEALTPEKRKSELIRVGRIFDSVRNMNNYEFEKTKEDNARQILLDQAVKRIKNEMSKAGKFLLDTRLVQLVQKRIAERE